jgi:hypothetical protein
MRHIKLRFQNTRKILRLVPEVNFDISIQDNIPHINTILDRNWARKAKDLSHVVPVYENRWEEDQPSSRDGVHTPQEVKDMLRSLRFYKRRD